MCQGRALTLFSSSNMIQHINVITHLNGNILEYVICREDENLIRSVMVGDMIVYHSTVLVNLYVAKPSPIQQKVTVRKTKSIDKTNFSRIFQVVYQLSPFPMIQQMLLIILKSPLSIL